MKYQLLEHVSLTEVDDEVVLLDLNTGSYYGLNHIGACLMKVLHECGSLEIATAQISEQYQTPQSRVKEDLDALVAQLIEQGLVAATDVIK